MLKQLITAVALSAGVFLLPSCTTIGGDSNSESYDDSLVNVNGGKADNDFVQPLMPQPSTVPSKSLPNMGRDKHGAPIYHKNQRTRAVRTTAYTHSESDHLVYGRKNAIGTNLKYTTTVRSAAADWSFYPLGTKFRVKGQPYLYVVDDYGSALTGTGTIDIYQPSKQLMRKWGRRYIEITIVQWGSAERSLAVLKGRSRYSHCRRMLVALESKTPRVQFASNN